MCSSLKRPQNCLQILLELYMMVSLSYEGVHSKQSSNLVEGNNEYCETEAFNASCGTDEVILMTRALYGRMKISRCVKLDYGHMGCKADVIELADSRCSGRRLCHIRIPETLFAQTKPCPDDLKPYLEANFRCVKASSYSSTDCIIGSQLRASVAFGYLINVVNEETTCGSVYRPWQLRAQPGQTIQITLLDFMVLERRKSRLPSNLMAHCPKYAVIREQLTAGTRNVTVCGGMERQRTVYTSTTNQLEIAISPQDDQQMAPRFLLQYEVIGCPDIATIPNGWSMRSADSVMIKCNFSRDVFHLKCEEHTWMGKTGNCSRDTLVKPERIEHEEIFSIPYGFSIMIVLAIALLIGLFVLFVGLLFLKRHRGLCSSASVDHENELSEFPDAHKEYNRSIWAQEGDGPLGSNPSRNSLWRDPEYAPFSTDLPPCTPLMDRTQKHALYGPLQPKLPCGCPTYISRADLDTSSLHSQNEAGPRKGKLLLRSADPHHYLVVNSERSNSDTNINTSPCQNVFQNKHGSMQTDDLKLKLRLAEVPVPNLLQGIRSSPTPDSSKNKDEEYTTICTGKVEPEASMPLLDSGSK